MIINHKYFKNKVALITGTSSGIGEALAWEFARNGANVILSDIKFDQSVSLAEELSKKFDKCVAVRCDVSLDGELEKVVAEGVKNFGKIDIVCANAGFDVPGNFENLKLDDYRRQFEVNIFGVLRTIYATLPELKKTKGNICITGSVAGFVPFPTGSSPYIMSKFAIRSFAESLNLELHPYQISVTHIMPGFVKTHFHNPNGFIKKISWLTTTPEYIARQTLKAIKNKKREVVLTKTGKFLVWLERYTPSLLRNLSKIFTKIKR